MLFLAVKHLKSKKKQTLITTCGVFLGTVAFIVVSGYTLGLEVFFKERLLDNDGHLRISVKEKFITERDVTTRLFPNGLVEWNKSPSGRKDSSVISAPSDWYRRLSKDSRVEAFTPQLFSQVIISRSSGSSSAVLIGMKPKEQLKVTPRLKQSIKKGSFQELEIGGNKIVLGKGLADRLGAGVGDAVRVTSANGGSSRFKVIAIFAIGLEEFDKSYAYANLSNVQSLTGSLSKISEITVRLKDSNKAQDFVDSLRPFVEDKVQSWKEINKTFVAIIGVQTAFRIVVIGILAVVISFGIYNIINISVAQKRKDIAILRSLGFSKISIVNLFTIQGFIIGFTGSALGLPIGYTICLKISQIQFSEAAGNINISFSPWIYVASVSVGILTTTLAGILPAWGAGKLDPIKVIRDGVE